MGGAELSAVSFAVSDTVGIGHRRPCRRGALRATRFLADDTQSLLDVKMLIKRVESTLWNSDNQAILTTIVWYAS